MVVAAAEAVEEDQVMRFLLTCENSNNPVPMNRLMKTSEANGAQEGNRTPDLRITSALLYRLSYLGRSFTLSLGQLCPSAVNAKGAR